MSIVEEHPIEESHACSTARMMVRARSKGDQRLASLKSQLVILVHGLGAPKLTMSPLRWKLDRVGYRTQNWGYPSTRDSIETHANRLADTLHFVSRDRSLSHIHLVTHSMGGILTRVALLKHGFPKLHRIVMLAPPNRGSHAARLAAPMFGWVCKPLKELSDSRDSFVHSLPDFRSFEEIELGIIEAKRDAVVTAESVKLDGQADHVEVNSRHGTLPWNPQAIRCVSSFLEFGRFNEECEGEA